MLIQLFIGSMIISLTIIVQAVFIGIAIATLNRVGGTLIKPPLNLKLVAALIAVTLWLLASHSISAWIWALTYLAVGAFESLEPALYFSVVSFTTLGFGDIVLSEQWRMLSGLSAANGLILFGLSTAFLVEFLSRLRQAQEAMGKEN